MSAPPIPAEHYVSPARAAAEWERMWTRVWLLAAHTASLPSPGSFVTFEIGPESILCVRQPSGEVRAFFNVCQHRGNRLCAASDGHKDPSADGFRCPYHHWEYALDGSLTRVPRPELFAPEQLVGRGLVEVRCAERLGFVFVSMANRPEPIDDYLAPVAALVDRYRPAEFVATQDTTVEVPCNWKLSCDLHNEGYHVGTLHGFLGDVVDAGQQRCDLLGRHSRFVVPMASPAPARTDGGRPRPMLLDYLKSQGAITQGFTGTVAEARRLLIDAVRARAAADAVDLAALDADQLVDKHQFHLFPNVQLNFFARRLELYRHRPHASDPRRACFDELVFERPGPSSPRPARPAKRRFALGQGSMGPVTDQDLALIPTLAAGMASRGFSGLQLSSLEAPIAHLHRVLEEYLGAG